MLRIATFLFLSTLPLHQDSQDEHASDPGSDGEAIAEHIHSIFRGYIEKDRDTVLATHTFDWLGYQSRSLRLVRGIEGYMVNADWALENGTGTKHEMLQIVPRIYGDIAVAPYVARYFIAQGEQEMTIIYRALDIYRRGEQGWNQCGTNICVLSDGPPQYPSLADFDTYSQLRPVPAGAMPAPSAAAKAAWKERRAEAADEKLLREATLRALLSVRDAMALGELRTEDWVGFELASTEVVIRDGAVAPAEDSWSARVASGEILDFEAQVYGDVALVFALLRASDEDGASFLVRTAEVYRRSGDGWRQSSAHANPVPDVLRQ